MVQKSRIGFTLFEMLLVVSVFAIIVAISAPIYIGFKNRNDVDIAAQVTVTALRRASVLSRSMQNDSSWGVLATTSQIIIFNGESYAMRNQAYDESFSINPSLQISGKNETIFSKFTGMPKSSGMIIFTSLGGEVRNIILNEKGTVTY